MLRLVLCEGLRLAAVGVSTGLLTALLAGDMLRTYLFGVTTWAPATHAAAAIPLLACSIAACWLPARRGVRVDPVAALRA